MRLSFRFRTFPKPWCQIIDYYSQQLLTLHELFCFACCILCPESREHETVCHNLKTRSPSYMFKGRKFRDVAAQAQTHHTSTLYSLGKVMLRDCITSWGSSSSVAVNAHGDRIAVKVQLDGTQVTVLRRFE